MELPAPLKSGNKLKFFLVVGCVLVVGFAAYFLYWGNTRFTKISACVSCHEIFVDYDEYKPVGGLSDSIEDFKRSEPYEPAFFKVTVGCAECHAYPFEEYRDSPHFDNDRGVQPGCVGCHEPHHLGQIFAWKFFYVNKGGLGESPFHAISNSLRDVPEWEGLRVELAKAVRQKMIDEDSVRCKTCHKTESTWFNKIKRHQKKTRKTCVECHYNLVHKDVKWANEKKK